MLKRAIQIIAIILLATLQIALGQWLTWWMPDLILAVLLAIGMFGETTDTVWWAAIGGLVLDITLGSPVGYYLISFGLIGMLVTSLNRRVFQQPTPLIAVGLFFFIILFHELALAFITDSLAVQLLIRTLGTTLLASSVYILLLTFGQRQEVIQLG